MVRWLQGCESRGCTPIALLIPVAKEVIPPEGEGGHDPGQSSQEMHLSGHDYNQEDVGGGGYESGQNSEAEVADYEGVEADADEEFQQMMEEEDEDGDSAYGDDSDESDDEHVVPNPASWSHDFSSSMTVNDGHDSAWEYHQNQVCLLYTSPSPRDVEESRMPSSA